MRDFCRGEAHDMTEDHNGALIGRQRFERIAERKLRRR